MPKQKQNDPQVLEHQTGRIEMISIESIPQDSGNIPIIVDFFVGPVRDFRSYLKAKRLLLKAGEIAP